MPTSPRIQRFIADATVDVAAATQDLKRDLQAAAGPLVEPIPASNEVLVTFVYFGEADTVTVACQLWPPNAISASQPMQRVAGTDAWFASTAADPHISTTYQFHLNPPGLGESMEEALAVMADPERLGNHMHALFESGRPDPFNPHKIYPLAGVMGGDPTASAGPERWESVLTLPATEPFPYPGQPARGGTLESHSLDGSALPGTRHVDVYLPHGYDRTRPYPVAVLLDGEMCLQVGQLDQLLDSAISAGDIPPFIAVFWHNLTISSRMVEMACNPALPNALADELLPWLRRKYNLTDDTEQTVIAGMSYGGLAALWTAHTRPDTFGAALAMSPSLWFTPEPDEAPEWLTRQTEESPLRKARLFVSVGTLETSPIPLPGAEGLTMISAARNFRDALKAHDAELVGYREEPAGHEMINVRRILIPGLGALLGNGEQRASLR